MLLDEIDHLRQRIEAPKCDVVLGPTLVVVHASIRQRTAERVRVPRHSCSVGDNFDAGLELVSARLSGRRLNIPRDEALVFLLLRGKRKDLLDDLRLRLANGFVLPSDDCLVMSTQQFRGHHVAPHKRAIMVVAPLNFHRRQTGLLASRV